LAIIIDYRKYPFLADLDTIINYRWRGLRFSTIISTPGNNIVKRTLELLETIISQNTIYETRNTGEEEVLSYYTLLLVARLFKDNKLLNRIALAYSKKAYQYLEKEPLNTLVEIASIIGIRAEIPRNYPLIPMGIRRNRLIYKPKPIKVYFKDYLKYVAKRLARDPKYSLTNQILDKGYVYLDREMFTRILEEAIYQYILDTAEKISPDQEQYGWLMEEAKKILEKTNWLSKRIMSEEFEKSIEGVIDFTAFPPCMKLLLERLKAGENLSHQERFAIAAFLARIGMDTEAILEYFKNAPDFNEKIARYQIEHIAGLRGSRKKYLPYSCETMRALNLCPVETPCKGGKNPLAVYKYNLWVKTRKEGSRKIREKSKSVSRS
jgi:DNA primase large subunit